MNIIAKIHETDAATSSKSWTSLRGFTILLIDSIISSDDAQETRQMEQLSSFQLLIHFYGS